MSFLVARLFRRNPTRILGRNLIVGALHLKLHGICEAFTASAPEGGVAAAYGCLSSHALAP